MAHFPKCENERQYFARFEPAFAHPGEPVRPVPLVGAAQQARAHHRRRRQRDDERDQDRDRQGDGEFAE